MKFNISRQLRIIIGVVALVCLIGVITVIAINSGKGESSDAEASPSPTLAATASPPATATPDPAGTTDEPEPTVTLDPASGSDTVPSGAATESNLPPQDMIDELIEQYQQNQAEKDAENG